LTGKRFSDIAYGALQAAFEPTRFIETGGVPQDSRQIDTTWEHPNVKGGPDRRYKTNRVLPIMEYGKMTMWTQSGLSWTLECSNAKASEDTVRALRDARAPEIAKTS
jgi:DNA polymerase-3 subunit epsilon